MSAGTTADPLLQPIRDHTQLPDKDNVPVRNSFENWQSELLSESLMPVLWQRHPDGSFFVGHDVGIYWRDTDPPQKGVKAPDWYYVPGVPRLVGGEMRRSYVLPLELMPPYLVLEYVSDDGAEERDRTPWEGKFWVYEHMIRPAFYGIYEPDSGKLEMHRHVEDRFEDLRPNERGRYELPSLGVELGIWEGTYHGYAMPWLRWWDSRGVLLPSPQDALEAERQRAEAERQRAEAERQRADKLAERLRALGINPDEVS
ncbi:MAG: Uma2 family endonuclease [Planctomycetia bacterium]|nr:Uma2 family endonuclease [Planctomycetia bacterium]